jgi:hypothetical protein
MAIGRYVVTQNTTVPPGAAATITPGEPETGGAAGFGSAATASGQLWGTTFLAGTPLILDTGSSLYAALNGAGALRAFADGDTRGPLGLSN